MPKSNGPGCVSPITSEAVVVARPVTDKVPSVAMLVLIVVAARPISVDAKKVATVTSRVLCTVRLRIWNLNVQDS